MISSRDLGDASDGIGALRDIAVNNLGKSRIAIIRDQVEALGFDARCIHCVPFHVLSLQLGMWGLLSLFGDGSDG